MTARDFLKLLYRVNLKTIYFNFKYLPFADALKFPVFVSNNVVLKKMAGKVEIKGRLDLGKIKIGYGNVGIFDKNRSKTIWQVTGTVVFAGTANIGHGSKINVGDAAELIIGENVVMTAETSIVTEKQVTIGNNCIFSWDVLIMDTDYHRILDQQGKVINSPSPILIGDNVWVGCRCLILKKSVIPVNSVIAAGSTVNKALSGDFTIFGGAPAVGLKSNTTWVH
jgi:serine acetyltransferase